MIYLEQNTVNPVVLELSLNSTLEAPYFLFEFISDMNKSVTYFTATDLSNYKCRSNNFQITLTGSAYTNLTASTLSLKSGSYTVNIYEASASTLSVSATTGNIISTATSLKAKVKGEDTELDPIYR